MANTTQTTQTETTRSRKKRATIGAAEKQLIGELRGGLDAELFPISGVQIKLTLILPCETFVLYRLSGKSYDTIADIVGLSKGSVFKLATAYQNMKPPFGGFEPLQINYLRKQLIAGRSLKDIADELNGALDSIQGVAFEDREPDGEIEDEPVVDRETEGEPVADGTSSGEWWESEAPEEERPSEIEEEVSDRGRVFEVPLQTFDSPIATETVTLRITVQGLKYYINDYKIDAVPEKTLADIISFRQGKKTGRQKNTNYRLWKNIAEYYSETEITLRNYVHQQVFPPELVALYRLSGYSYKDIIDTVPPAFRKLLALTESRLISVQKISYRNNPKFHVIDVADLLQMLLNETSGNKISDADVEAITSKYKSFLTASTTQLDRKTARAKIFQATLTPNGIANYIKDILKPGHAQATTKKPGRPRKESDSSEHLETVSKKRGRPRKEKAEGAKESPSITNEPNSKKPPEEKAAVKSKPSKTKENKTVRPKKGVEEDTLTATTEKILPAAVADAQEAPRKEKGAAEPASAKPTPKKRSRPRKKKEEYTE